MQLLKDIQNDVEEFANFVNNVNGEIDTKKFKTLIEAVYYRMCAYLRHSCGQKYGSEGEKALNEILKTKENFRPMPDDAYKSYARRAGVKGADVAIKDVLYRIIFDLGTTLRKWSGDKDDKRQEFSDNCLSQLVDATNKGLKYSGKQNIKLSIDLKAIHDYPIIK